MADQTTYKCSNGHMFSVDSQLSPSGGWRYFSCPECGACAHATTHRTPRQLAADLDHAQRTTGAPAFPNGTHGSGMSLRDWFAGQCMVGLLGRGNPADLGQLRQMWADEAYILADALLAAREGK